MKEYGSAQFDRRRYPRLDFTFPLAFQVAGRKSEDGMTSNVSLGGLMSYLPHQVSVGQILEVSLLLPLRGDKEVFKAMAEVVWARNGQFEGGWVCCVGLQLLEMSPECLKLWRVFLSEWMEGQPSHQPAPPSQDT